MKFQISVAQDFKERMSLNCGTASQLVIENAQGKAREVAEKEKEALVIGCDTVIVFENEVLGKPNSSRGDHKMPMETDRKEAKQRARRTLQKLSGEQHTVISGLAIIDTITNKEVTACQETTVTFRKLTDQEIEAYVATGEPFDKAGAYGIQGIGGQLVEGVDGSISNVMGLPQELLVRLLKEFELELGYSCSEKV